MKASPIITIALACGLSAVPAAAQNQYEIGALGLVSDYRSVAVSNGGSTGEVGPGFGFSGGFILGQNLSNRWGGEFRYIYFRNDLELTGNGQKAELGAQSHSIGYDVLYYFKDPDARVRPYVAAGFGMKYWQGTGKEDPFQPLSGLALLTATTEVTPVGDFGMGVKIRVGEHGIFRVEFRDYISGVPKEVIAASPGANLDGILHQWAPLFGFSWTW